MNPYQVLDVSPACTLQEIETRYRSQLLIYHPDLNRQKGPEVVAQAEKKTRQLNEAMALLRRQHPAGGVKVGSTERPSERAGSAGPPNGSGRAGSAGPDGRTGHSGGGVPFSWGPPPADPNRVYDCPLCGNITKTLPDFEEHVERAHNISLDPRAKTKPPRRRIIPIGVVGAIFRFAVWAAIVLLSFWIYFWVVSNSRGLESLTAVGLAIWILVVTWVMFSRQR